MSLVYFTVYKTTNIINGKFYIGKHQTSNLNDGYIGSGKLLKRAIQKYGLDNFKTEIIEVYDQEWKMNLAERILVVQDQMSYNLCSGGKGGFDYINRNKLNIGTLTEEGRKKLSEAGKKVKELELGIFKWSSKQRSIHSKSIGLLYSRMSQPDYIPWNKGKKLSRQHKKRVGDALRGRVYTEEQRKQKSEQMKNYYRLNPKKIERVDGL